MNYAYVWLESTLDELADIYVAASSEERKRMAAGVAGFNTQISKTPLEVGESRPGAYRIAFPPLLCAYFYVDVDHRRVEVVHVEKYGK